MPKDELSRAAKYVKTASLISILGAVHVNLLGKYLRYDEDYFKRIVAGLANDGFCVRSDGSVISNSDYDDTSENLAVSDSVLKIMRELDCKVENFCVTQGPAVITIMVNYNLMDIIPVRKDMIQSINACLEYFPEESYRIFPVRDIYDVKEIIPRKNRDIVAVENDKGIGEIIDLRQVKEIIIDR